MNEPHSYCGTVWDSKFKYGECGPTTFPLFKQGLPTKPNLLLHPFID